MTLSLTISTRRIAALAVVALFAAIGAGTAPAAPTAQAHDHSGQLQALARPDDRAGIRGPSSPSAARPAPQPADSSVRPDDRGGTRGPGSPGVATRTAPVAGGPGFDWGDAGIGAGSTLGLILLGSCVRFVGVRRRRHAVPQSAAAQVAHG
jgi:hypothetical protein